MSIWYVRPIAGEYGTEDGMSYESAYDGFAGITWGVGGVVAGDTLYVCGSHTEQLIVGVAGSSGSVVTIRGDYPTDAGDIDAENTRAYGIQVASKDYVLIKNITVANAENGANGEGIKIQGSDNCIIDNVVSTGCKWNGLQLDYSNDCTIKNCTVHDGVAASGKGISIAGDALGPSTGNLVENCNSYNNGTDNYVISGLTGTQTTLKNTIKNCTSSGASRYGYQIDQCDGTQLINSTSSGETNSNIYHKDAINTYITGCTFTGNAAADMIQVVGHAGLTSGNLRIWGNTFKDLTFNGYAIETLDLFVSGLSVCGNIFDSCTRGVRGVNNTGQRFCNNVCIDTQECYRAQVVVDSANLIVSNNIFTHTGATGNGFVFTNVAAGNDFTIDNNHYYAPSDVNNAFVRYNGTSYKVADYTTIDTNGTDGAPQLGADYKLPDGSLLIAAGVRYWDDVNPVGADGNPFSDWSVPMGAFQGTDAINNPFIPVNL